MSNFTYENKGALSEAYETYEWDNTWIDHANDTKSKRVFWIGDSISCGTRNVATSKSDEKIFFDGFGSSKSIDNPYLIPAVDLFYQQLPSTPAAILLNNGLHGWHLKDETEYKTAYGNMIAHLQKTYPDSRIFLILTTALKKEDENERVISRNKVALELAETYGVPVIDFYSIVDAHRELLSPDGIHPLPELYDMLAAEILKNVENL